MHTPSLFPRLQKILLLWFDAHKRPLPWRSTYEPYATWIAEIMLQQTQMERGVAYFERWMHRFPDVRSVALADENALLTAWEGLGYYRRARNIQAAAQVIMAQHGGMFPSQFSDILDLPGVGPYTAGAIASTAFNLPVPCVDGNVERVLARLFDIDSPVKAQPAKGRIHELASALIPQGQARAFNQALMEFGALVCRKKPLCAACPLTTLCESYRLGIANERPVAGKRATIKLIDVATGVLESEGRVFIQRRKDKDVWAGLWEFPGGCVEAGETPEQAMVREWQEEVEFPVTVVAPLTRIKHSYTTYRITLHCFRLAFANLPASLSGNSAACSLAACPAPKALHEATDFRWLFPEELGTFPMPAPHRKLADLLSTLHLK